MDCGSNKTKRAGLLYLSLLPLLGLLISLVPISSNAVVQLPFLQDTKHQRILAFAGFPACSSACPISLNTLRQTYLDYSDLTDKQDIGVVFINIRRDMPKQISYEYIKSFHEDFTAYSTNNSDSKLLYTSLGIKTYSVDEKIKQHKGYIYLFQAKDNQWRVEKIFDNDVDNKTMLTYLINHPV